MKSRPAVFHERHELFPEQADDLYINASNLIWLHGTAILTVPHGQSTHALMTLLIVRVPPIFRYDPFAFMVDFMTVRRVF
jgi:hypothetical protein